MCRRRAQRAKPARRPPSPSPTPPRLGPTRQSRPRRRRLRSPPRRSRSRLSPRRLRRRTAAHRAEAGRRLQATPSRCRSRRSPSDCRARHGCPRRPRRRSRNRRRAAPAAGSAAPAKPALGPYGRPHINPYRRDIDMTVPLMYHDQSLGDLPVRITFDDQFFVETAGFLQLIDPKLNHRRAGRDRQDPHRQADVHGRRPQRQRRAAGIRPVEPLDRRAVDRPGQARRRAPLRPHA